MCGTCEGRKALQIFIISIPRMIVVNEYTRRCPVYKWRGEALQTYPDFHIQKGLPTIILVAALYLGSRSLTVYTQTQQW